MIIAYLLESSFYKRLAGFNFYRVCGKSGILMLTFRSYLNLSSFNVYGTYCMCFKFDNLYIESIGNSTNNNSGNTNNINNITSNNNHNQISNIRANNRNTINTNGRK